MVWTRLLGARFTGHIPGTHKLNIVLTGTKHPITAGVEPFSIVDEEYKHRFAEVDRHVLARFRERPPTSDQNANMDILWTREIGKGRVFYSALGHGKEAWENPAWQKLIIQSILWAAGRPRGDATEVTRHSFDSLGVDPARCSGQRPKACPPSLRCLPSSQDRFSPAEHLNAQLFGTACLVDAPRC